jgi:hypothetical protein
MEETVGQKFENRKFGGVFATTARTNKAMDKWMLQLDSAGQK